MKLLYCPHCTDVVRLFPERRTCKCGKSWGHYLDDNSTTVQTWPSLSLGIANPDFVAAERAFAASPETFSPLLAMRCWINPLSEPDVKLVQGVPISGEQEGGDEDSASVGHKLPIRHALGLCRCIAGTAQLLVPGPGGEHPSASMSRQEGGNLCRVSPTGRRAGRVKPTPSRLE